MSVMAGVQMAIGGPSGHHLKIEKERTEAEGPRNRWSIPVDNTPGLRG